MTQRRNDDAATYSFGSNNSSFKGKFSSLLKNCGNKTLSSFIPIPNCLDIDARLSSIFITEETLMY